MTIALLTIVGSYYAASGEGRGDPALALRAAEMWTGLGFTYEPDAFDGVEVCERPDGKRFARVCARDLFTGCRLIRELDPDTGKPFDLEPSR